MLNNQIFKSIMFDHYMYLKSIKEPNSDILCYFMCIYIDEKTTAAFEIDDESFNEFIEANRNVNFCIDKTKTPIKENGKTIYFLKKS